MALSNPHWLKRRRRIMLENVSAITELKCWAVGERFRTNFCSDWGKRAACLRFKRRTAPSSNQQWFMSAAGSSPFLWRFFCAPVTGTCTRQDGLTHCRSRLCLHSCPAGGSGDKLSHFISVDTACSQPHQNHRCSWFLCDAWRAVKNDTARCRVLCLFVVVHDKNLNWMVANADSAHTTPDTCSKLYEMPLTWSW